MVILAAVKLVACAGFPVASMYKLRNFDPTTTDIHLLRFAVRVPDEIGIATNGIQLILGTEHKERANLQDTFILESIDDRAALARVKRDGTQTYAFRIGSDDIERFTRLREKIRLEKNYDAKGRLEVKADVCRTTPALPPEILISTFVSASETNGYVALLLDADLLSEADHKSALELVPECISQ